MSETDEQFHSPAILLVDDDPDILTALHDLLDHEGYEVTCVSTCEGALAQANECEYDAVLLDLGLPDGDGLSVLDILRERDPTLPVIVLTAFDSPEYAVNSLSRGAFSCVKKPYDRDTLCKLLRRAVASPTAGTPDLSSRES